MSAARNRDRKFTGKKTKKNETKQIDAGHPDGVLVHEGTESWRKPAVHGGKDPRKKSEFLAYSGTKAGGGGRHTKYFGGRN